MKSELQHYYILTVVCFKGNAHDNNVSFMELDDLKTIPLHERNAAWGII